MTKASGIHDMGGTRGWGPAPVPEAGEPVFAQRWQARAFALALLSIRLSGTNLDAFRHAMNRLDRQDYLDDGYYGRWLHGAENLLHDSSIIAPGTAEARAANLSGGSVAEPEPPVPDKPDYAPTAAGSLRAVPSPPRFAVGAAVRAKTFDPPGHTRLPRYVMGHAGTVTIIQPAQVLPDTNAHFQGENAQWVYAVRFESAELFGPDAEPFTLTIDLYEDYLEEAP
ncbi:nitrile hydratase subunit beta [Nonomuraea sediminis]|uniref:nitrile hydratase subunit beta n=1 Tax=Nonomuraea sediminis TaxID=2835864 RepID=UPI001BDCDEAC|nr:nitrile hydratase subunit beta [Nonomuraea sediminis]